jgi:lipopolysaccharide/colanic/teichoic acid biosynthesis glycosyltransferase
MRITPFQQTESRSLLARSAEREFLPEAQFLACVRKERQRSDRSRATLSLISLRLPKLGGTYDPGLDYALEAIPRRVRSLDEAGWLEPGVVGILLPETSKEGAWSLAKDLKRNDMTGYLRTAEINVYTYPDSKDPKDSGPGDGGNGRREPGERNGNGERRQPSVAREGVPTHVSAEETRAAHPLLELLLDKEPWWKRPVDVAGASLALVILSPLMLGTALAIKLGSPGPVLYSSWRVGKGGAKFRFHKFRTMCVDAEKKKQELLAQNEADGPVFKMERDPRVTPIGRILRKTSIDELPQFWNVLIGDMALVGPRPPIPEETVWYAPWQRRRLELKGGLTCLWQVSGRSNVSFEEWCRLDVKYHENRSFLGDIWILFRTVPAVLAARGAR